MKFVAKILKLWPIGVIIYRKVTRKTKDSYFRVKSPLHSNKDEIHVPHTKKKFPLLLPLHPQGQDYYTPSPQEKWTKNQTKRKRIKNLERSEYMGSVHFAQSNPSFWNADNIRITGKWGSNSPSQNNNLISLVASAAPTLKAWRFPDR